MLAPTVFTIFSGLLRGKSSALFHTVYNGCQDNAESISENTQINQADIDSVPACDCPSQKFADEDGERQYGGIDPADFGLSLFV